VASFDKKPWSEPYERAFRALIELSSHLILVIGLLAGFRLIEWVMHLLWGPTERQFFGKLNLKDLIDAADLAILIGFLCYGIYKVVAAYVRNAHANPNR
jgi:hypothetical protein